MPDLYFQPTYWQIVANLKNGLEQTEFISTPTVSQITNTKMDQIVNQEKKSDKNLQFKYVAQEIIEELGEIPYNKFSDIFNQVIAQLIKTPRLIIVDETDYLTIDSRAVETLRDIHDKTNVPSYIIIVCIYYIFKRHMVKFQHMTYNVC